MRISLLYACLFFLILLSGTGSCKKEKTYTITGRLLVSRSNPVPVAGYQLRLYQSGSGGAPIAMGTFPASAEGRTDNAGFFRLRFTEGKGNFLGIPTRNQNAVSLSGKDATSHPNFYIVNFPYQASSGETIYLYKKADTVYLKLKVAAPIVATDSFTIYANNVSGNLLRVKKGFTAPANTELFLDTINSATFPHYDFAARKYINHVSIRKNRDLLHLPHSSPKQDSLPEQDEKSLTFQFTSF